jgi:hypothetical protein
MSPDHNISKFTIRLSMCHPTNTATPNLTLKRSVVCALPYMRRLPQDSLTPRNGKRVAKALKHR